MIYTVRQLEDLYKAHGRVVLPYRARLTPLAIDWVKVRKGFVGYSDGEAMKAPAEIKGSDPLIPMPPSKEITGTGTIISPPSAADFLWWCDGPCGPAKAAVMSQSRESSLAALDVPADGKFLVSAVKRLASDMKTNRAIGGVLLVTSGAPAVVYANHCPSLRAILGTCRESVMQGIAQVSANVLVIEHPYQTLAQVKNMLAIFCRGNRVMNDEQRRVMQELASCA
jgi:hypothetical protein